METQAQSIRRLSRSPQNLEVGTKTVEAVNGVVRGCGVQKGHRKR